MTATPTRRETVYYANYNKYGSEGDVGFANTNQALAFETKRARDEYVEEYGNRNLSIRPITAALAHKMTRPEGDGSRIFQMPIGDAWKAIRL